MQVVDESTETTLHEQDHQVADESEGTGANNLAQNYSDWLHAPGALNAEQPHYLFSMINDQEIRANEENFGESYDRSEQASQFPLRAMGVDYETVAARLSVGLFVGSTVVSGSFNESAVVSGLESAGFEQDGEYAGYTLMRNERSTQRGDVTQLIAVNGSTVVAAQGSTAISGPPVDDTVETTIDAGRGEVDRYAEANEDMQVLLGELGTGVSVLGTTQEPTQETNLVGGEFEGQVAAGQTSTIDGETAEQTFVTVFQSSADVNTADLEEWTETSEDFEGISNISISQSGRVVTVTGEADTTSFFSDEQ